MKNWRCLLSAARIEFITCGTNCFYSGGFFAITVSVTDAGLRSSVKCYLDQHRAQADRASSSHSFSTDVFFWFILRTPKHSSIHPCSRKSNEKKNVRKLRWLRSALSAFYIYFYIYSKNTFSDIGDKYKSSEKVNRCLVAKIPPMIEKIPPNADRLSKRRRNEKLLTPVFFRVEDFTSNRKHQQFEYADIYNFYDIKSWDLAVSW